jgi:hypothetical protein
VQVTFTAQGLGINGIPNGQTLPQALVQLPGVGPVVVKVLKQTPLSLLETLGERLLLPFQSIESLQDTAAGLPQPLPLLKVAPLLNQLAA